MLELTKCFTRGVKLAKEFNRVAEFMQRMSNYLFEEARARGSTIRLLYKEDQRFREKVKQIKEGVEMDIKDLQEIYEKSKSCLREEERKSISSALELVASGLEEEPIGLYYEVLRDVINDLARLTRMIR
jgi:hypothetical protein